MFVIPPVSKLLYKLQFQTLSLGLEKGKHNADSNGKKPEQTPGEINGEFSVA